MTPSRCTVTILAAVIAVPFLVGCASSERAVVRISYVVEPSQGLPQGMNTVAVLDSKVNEVTDRKWSELAANEIQHHIQQANNRFGSNLNVVDRKHLGEVMGEQDLAAAGLTDANVNELGKLANADGLIESEINVKVEAHTGKASTITGLGGWGGHRSGGGHIETGEVDTVSRNIAVQTSFKLVDTRTNRNWVTYSPPLFTQSDKTKAFFLFGSSRTEAELTPRDEVIRAAVATGVQGFISMIVPCEINYEVTVESGGSEASAAGVKHLRAQAYGDALAAFQGAVAEDPGDYRSLFGAGVAAEAAGDYDTALDFYRRAYGAKPDPQYQAARDRLAEDIGRIKKSA